jgi:DNA-binding IclR family transcriptional regulator
VKRALPALIDVRTACEETGLPKSTVRRIMRASCEVVRPDGVRRIYVYRSDFERALGLDPTRRR